MDDKIVAATAGMAAVLYILACGIAWYRVLSPTYSRPALRYVLDRAVAWSALSVIFCRIVGVRLRLIDWGNDWLDAALATALFAIWSCGLISVRAFTVPRFGWRIWAFVAFVSAITGLIILLC